jgi:hypothetical protein
VAGIENVIAELGADLEIDLEDLLDRDDPPSETSWEREWSEVVRRRVIAKVSSARPPSSWKN